MQRAFEAARAPAAWHGCARRPRWLRGIRPVRAPLSASTAGTWPRQGYNNDNAMIQTEAQLQQAIEQIENLCGAVEALRKDIFPQNPRNFAILAEGPVDEIRKLQALIDDYLSRLEALPAATAK